MPLYLGTLLVISLSGAFIALAVIRRHAVESDEDSRLATAQRIRTTWLTTAVFAICFGVSWWSPDAALYGLLLLIPARMSASRASNDEYSVR